MKLYRELIKARLEQLGGATAGLIKGLIYYRTDTDKPYIDTGTAAGAGLKEIMVREELSGEATGPYTTPNPIKVDEGGTNLNPTTFAAGVVGQVLVKKNATEYEFADPGGSIKIEKTEAAHGFALLDPIYHDGINWLKAQANDPETLAEFVVSEIVDANTFKATKFGELTGVDIGNRITALGLVVGEHYFLSDLAAGGVLVTEPVTYSSPVFYVESADTIQVEVYRPSSAGSGSGGGITSDLLANLTALPRDEGKVYYATDTDLLYTDDGSVLTPVDGTIRGIDVQNVAPTDGQALIYSTSNNRYEPGSAGSDIAILRDQKPLTNNGGTFTQGVWQTRELNLIQENAPFLLSLSANRFTLAAGSYILEVMAPAYAVERHRCRLFNVTAGNTAKYGANSYSSLASDGQTHSPLMVGWTFGVNTILEVQHRCQQTKATNGFGLSVNMDAQEFYTQVKITKIG